MVFENYFIMFCKIEFVQKSKMFLTYFYYFYICFKNIFYV